MVMEAKLPTSIYEDVVPYLILNADPRDGFWLKVVVEKPKGMKGRNVFIHFSEGDRDKFLKALREECVRARR